MTVEHRAAWSSEQNACKKLQALLKTFGRVRKVAQRVIQPSGVSDQREINLPALRPRPSAAQRLISPPGSMSAQE
jgi:hypothetical protein